MTLKFLITLILSAATFCAVLRFPLIWLERWPRLWLRLSCLFALLPMFPFIGVRLGGAHRWLALPGEINLPSHYLVLILFMLAAAVLSAAPPVNKWHKAEIVALTFVTLLALLFQPHFWGASAFLLLVLMALSIQGRWKLALATGMISTFAVVLNILILRPYKLHRLIIYLDPASDPLTRGYQALQNLAVFSKAQWFGQTMTFEIPQSPPWHANIYGDFAMIAGRFGLAAASLFIVLLACIMIVGVWRARRQTDPRLRTLGLLMSLALGCWTWYAAAWPLGIVPTTGVPLPLVGGVFAGIFASLMLGFIYRASQTCVAAIPPGRSLKIFTVLIFVGTAQLLFTMHALQRPQPHPSPQRGQIQDASGIPLAVTVKRQSAYIYLEDARRFKESSPSGYRQFSVLLEHFIGKDVANRFEQKLANQDFNFHWLKRGLSDGELTGIRALLAAPGGWMIHLEAEQGRSYPARELTSKLVGFTLADNIGGEGIEHRYEKELASGQNVRLAVSLPIQLESSRVLKPYLEKYRAKSISAVVLRVRDARPLAILSLPGFDPDKFSITPSSLRRLEAITDSHQLGALFRPFMLAEMLETKPDMLVKLDTDNLLRIPTNGNALSLSLGRKEMLNAASRFGFGQKTGVDFDGEAISKVNPETGISEKISQLGLGNGYCITGSLLRNSLSFNALIDGGELFEARLLDRVAPPGNKQVIRQITSEHLRQIMTESVRKASGGKISDMGGFWGNYVEHNITSREQHHHVVGAFFAPADNPEYLVLFDMLGSDATKADKNLGLEIGAKLLEALK